MKRRNRTVFYMGIGIGLAFVMAAVSGCSAAGRRYTSVDISEAAGQSVSESAGESGIAESAGESGFADSFGESGSMDSSGEKNADGKDGPGKPQTLKLAVAQTKSAGDEGMDGGAAAGGETGAEADSDRAEGEFTLLFAGDVYFSDHVMEAYRQGGGIGGVLDEGIRGEIAQADIFMVNQEFPFTDRGEAAADKQFTFRIPPEKVVMMNEMGVDIVTMANNHILDFGPDGITDSIAALDQAGILHVGAGENLEQASRPETITVRGKTVGFLGASRVYMSADWAAGPSHPGVFSAYDPAPVVRAIEAARPLCDYLVVYVHWGVERETTPQSYQRAMGRQFIDAGADLVIGSHPHVLQETEYYNGKPIVYSLGNFVFGSSIPETKLLKVTVGADGDAELTDIFCRSSAGYTRLR